MLAYFLSWRSIPQLLFLFFIFFLLGWVYFLTGAEADGEPDGLLNKLTVVTYNIEHGSQGLDKVLDVLRNTEADIIALNEVDNVQMRSNFVFQGHWLAKQLGMYCYFGPAMDIGYGNALLSRYRLSQVRNVTLFSFRENRGCITGLLFKKGERYRFFVIHLGLNQKERMRHLGEIKILMDSYPEKNKVLLGDFNVKPDAPEIKMITKDLIDTFAHYGIGDETTYPAIPGARIDYIFTSPSVKIKEVKVLPQIASDHQAVTATMFLENEKSIENPVY